MHYKTTSNYDRNVCATRERKKKKFEKETQKERRCNEDLTKRLVSRV
ncbi:hypothetical protein PUN28_003121 [Cardiocondyla obscurior]|uniref:Uncharacterized protein n=1 Tax=Cardiocondyla obscurior TaxID=286306 RepID=A0AAW2GL79_9HYME